MTRRLHKKNALYVISFYLEATTERKSIPCAAEKAVKSFSQSKVFSRISAIYHPPSRPPFSSTLEA
jgi:hypothetical protein